MKQKAIFFMVNMILLSSILCPYVLAVDLGKNRHMSEPDYEGFLISLSENCSLQTDSAELNAGLEYVVDNVYWTEDAEYAQWLLDTGQANYVEPNYVVSLFDDESDETDTYGWPYEAINADYAENFGLNGSGVRIAVIDSGLDLDNPDLQEANICEGYDYILGTSLMSDNVYHGTKVTQLICADKNALGVTGIARGAEIVPLRCFSSTNGGTIKIVAQAIVDAVTVYNCQIINMSWGLSEDSQVLYEAIRTAFDSGATLVAAAGNITYAAPSGTVIYPASYEEVISVASVDSSLTVLSSSQRNEMVTVCAPGGSIGFITSGGNTSVDSGTSFACPCIASIIAVLKQLAPGIDNSDIFDLLQSRAIDLGDPGYDAAYGYGFIKLDSLLGSTWGHVQAFPTEQGIHAALSAWILSSDGGYIAAAMYDECGKMTNISLMEGQQNYNFFYITFDMAKEDARLAVFYLDKNFTALSESNHFVFP